LFGWRCLVELESVQQVGELTQIYLTVLSAGRGLDEEVDLLVRELAVSGGLDLLESGPRLLRVQLSTVVGVQLFELGHNLLGAACHYSLLPHARAEHLELPDAELPVHVLVECLKHHVRLGVVQPELRL
ncbi:hypothetical protein EGW08_001918, partial [Elysia chlorotica]